MSPLVFANELNHSLLKSLNYLFWSGPHTHFTGIDCQNVKADQISRNFSNSTMIDRNPQMKQRKENGVGLSTHAK
ncbi:MAG: hypothetical protein B7Z59_00975 [Acidiphilium sp. 37-67-22]|nr:MAG: hypothetical protein B7Z64_00805 [Acidiphilium sp. 21-68-69]OYW12548.1 MAG: hypothetical protein B7Z59_00975 [Acidiphilium sp. 37-67-22]